MPSAEDFESAAQIIARKYFHFGVAAEDIAGTFSDLGAKVAADTATTQDITVQDPAPGLAPTSWPDDLHREILLLVNKGRADPGAAVMGQTLIDLANDSGLLPEPPVNTNPPQINGSYTVGGALTCTNGAWDGSPTAFTRQWFSGDIPVSTDNTYTTVDDDVGQMIGCAITATNDGGSATANAAPLGPITEEA
jgi:hypothetical protein